MQTEEISKKSWFCIRSDQGENNCYKFTRGGWYVTTSPAQNKNSSFVCHFPMYFPPDRRDSTVIGRDLASPYEAGKWPLPLIGPLVKNKDNLQEHVLECHWLMKVTMTLEPEHFQHPSDCPPQNFQHWLMLREKASVMQNPNSCDGNSYINICLICLYLLIITVSDELMVLQRSKQPTHQPTFGSIWEDGCAHSYVSLQDIREAFLSKKCVL